MKRFTDTDKWKDPWFRKLPVEYKNLWQYITDNCDNAGVWKPDFELASFCISQSVEHKEALKLFNQNKERIKVLDNDKWYITDFISFQYGVLTEACKPHVQVLSLLKRHNLYEGYAKGIHTLKEKDKDKDQDKEEDKKKRFIKPSLEEVGQYIAEQGYTVEPESFFNFYESKGWKIGNQPMRDWKAAIRTWQSKNKNKALEQRVGKQTVNNLESLKRFNQKMELEKKQKILQAEVCDAGQ